jgi:6-phosphofructokinase 1
MDKRMKRIGLLTSGGDAPGMNAAIRSVVRSAIYHKMEVMGIFRGYDGLINEDMKILGHRSVSNIINRGGTILKTDRSDKFRTVEGRRRAYEVIKKNNIDGLVLIGGDGTYRGGYIFNKEWGIPCIGVPGSIDNDIRGTDFTIGSDTAVNTALEAIDKIRDTATSMERIFVVEVMGRSSGYIAINAALSGGAEDVLVPERKYDMRQLCQDVVEGNLRGKMSWIVIVAEGVSKATDIAKVITDTTSLETRVVTLGHIQRGGSPTAKDRILATRLGAEAVNLLRKGMGAKAVGVIGSKINIVGLGSAVTKSSSDVNSLYRLIKMLT